jgi:hypothetical protein
LLHELPEASHSAQPGAKDPADAGQLLRQIFLSTKAAELGMAPSTDFPRVYGVAMDWPIGDDDRVDYIVTVIAAKGVKSLTLQPRQAPYPYPHLN